MRPKKQIGGAVTPEEPGDWHEPPHVRMLAHVNRLKCLASKIPPGAYPFEVNSLLLQLSEYFEGLCQHCGYAEPVEPGHDRCHDCLLHEGRDEGFADPFGEGE
jgi:hypothetical protein